jgi:hypothetical protein
VRPINCILTQPGFKSDCRVAHPCVLCEGGIPSRVRLGIFVPALRQNKIKGGGQECLPYTGRVKIHAPSTGSGQALFLQRTEKQGRGTLTNAIAPGGPSLRSLQGWDSTVASGLGFRARLGKSKVKSDGQECPCCTT